MADLRQTEILQAQNNPQIGVPLSGAPSQADGMQSPDFGRAQQVAGDLSSKLYGGGFVQGGESQKDAMVKQLFDYDQKLAGGQSPFPQIPGYVQNPADTYRGAAPFISGMGQSIGQIGSTLSTTERAYQDATSAALSKLVDFLTLSEQRRKDREDREYEQKKRDFDTEVELRKLTGGQVTDPFTGKMYTIPAPKVSKAGTFNVQQALQTMRSRGSVSGTQTPQSAQSQNTFMSKLSQPGYSGVYTVREKATGRLGTIPSNEYNAGQYEFVK